MKVTIKTIKKDAFDVELKSGSRVLDLKKEISSIRKVELDHIKLIYSGQILNDDDQTIEQLDLKDDHFIVMMVRKPRVVQSQQILAPQPIPPQPLAPESLPPQPLVPAFSETAAEQAEQPEQLIEAVELTGLTGDDMHHSEEVYREVLSDTKIQQLYQILNNDPMINELLQSYPQLRDKLKDPEVLLELLSRMNHPIVEQLDQSEEDDGPNVVQVTPEEKTDLDLIKSQIIEVVGPVTHISDGQFNALIYQAYTMANKDVEMAKHFLIDELLEGYI